MNAAGGLTLDAGRTGLVLVDIQARLANAMPSAVLDGALRNWLLLIETAARLKLPVCVSEQYPKGLGRTLPVLHEAVSRMTPPATFIEKLDFSLCEAPLFSQVLGSGRTTWIVCGMETHVCVYQTVRGLRERGFAAHVPRDAVVSRKKHDWRVGLDLMQRAGGVVSSTETILFDLLKRAGSDEFRALSKLIK